MDRTDEFFEYFSEFNSIGSAARVLQKSDHNHFHEAARKIANLLDSIMLSIKETSEPYIDTNCSILSRKSDMSDVERVVFVQQTSDSITSSEQLIGQLAENIKSGKLGLKGDAIDHAIGVLACLDLSLNQIRRSFSIMKAQRENVKIRLSSISANPPPVTPSKNVPKISKNNSNSNTSTKIQISDPDFQQKLEQEHDTVMTELLEMHDQITETERLAEEIATLSRMFNELMVEQTEKIRVIRADVEKATVNYEDGTKQVVKSIDRTKLQHLWMSLVILFLSFVLVMKKGPKWY